MWRLFNWCSWSLWIDKKIIGAVNLFIELFFMWRQLGALCDVIQLKVESVSPVDRRSSTRRTMWRSTRLSMLRRGSEADCVLSSKTLPCLWWNTPSLLHSSLHFLMRNAYIYSFCLWFVLEVVNTSMYDGLESFGFFENCLKYGSGNSLKLN